MLVRDFVQAGCPSQHLTNSVKALEDKYITTNTPRQNYQHYTEQVLYCIGCHQKLFNSIAFKLGGYHLKILQCTHNISHAIQNFVLNALSILSFTATINN